MSSGTITNMCLRIHPATGMMMVVGFDGTGIVCFTSADGGTSWQGPTTVCSPASATDIPSLDCTAGDKATWRCILSNNGTAQVYDSTDDGATWSIFGSSPANTNGSLGSFWAMIDGYGADNLYSDGTHRNMYQWHEVIKTSATSWATKPNGRATVITDLECLTWAHNYQEIPALPNNGTYTPVVTGSVVNMEMWPLVIEDSDYNPVEIVQYWFNGTNAENQVSTTFPALLTDNATMVGGDSVTRNSYSWEEAVKNASGYPGWVAKAGGRTGTKSTSTAGYNVAEIGTPSGTVWPPVPNATLVQMQIVTYTSSGTVHTEYWFTVIDGGSANADPSGSRKVLAAIQGTQDTDTWTITDDGAQRTSGTKQGMEVQLLTDPYYDSTNNRLSFRARTAKCDENGLIVSITGEGNAIYLASQTLTVVTSVVWDGTNLTQNTQEISVLMLVGSAGRSTIDTPVACS